MNCPRCRSERIHPFFAGEEADDSQRRQPPADYGVSLPVGICFALFLVATLLASAIDDSLAVFCAGLGVLCVGGLAAFLGLQSKLEAEGDAVFEPEEEQPPEYWVCGRCGAVFGHGHPVPLPPAAYPPESEPAEYASASSAKSPSSARTRTDTGEDAPPGPSTASSV